MSLESLLQYVPPEAIHRREPLEEDRNALGPWRKAVEYFFKPEGEGDLWGELTYGIESGDKAGSADSPAVRELLEKNRKTFESLEEGLRRGRLQFPEVCSPEDIRPASEFVSKLGEAARLPLIRSRVLQADRQLAPAVREVIQALHIGQMICRGQGQMLHYLVGLWIESAALREMERLTAREDLLPAEVAELKSAVEGGVQGPDGLAESLRADLCSISLPQLDKTPEGGRLQGIVDRLLEIQYGSGAGLRRPAGEDVVTTAWHRPLGRRRKQVLFLLEGHPRPFDKRATARLMGELVADTISQLNDAWGAKSWDVRVHLRRLCRAIRHRRLTREVASWPAQLISELPWTADDEADPGPEAVAGAGGEPDSTDSPLSGAELTAARDRLRGVDNPVGLILAQYLLAVDYSPFALRHRAKLEEVRQMLAVRLRRGA